MAVVVLLDFKESWFLGSNPRKAHALAVWLNYFGDVGVWDRDLKDCLTHWQEIVQIS